MSSLLRLGRRRRLRDVLAAVFLLALASAVAGTYTARAHRSDVEGDVVFSPVYREEVMADSPSGYWRLGEATGTTAADERGANPGNYLGGPSLGEQGAVGDPNSSARLDGLDDTVRVPNSASLNSATALSLEIWLEPNELPSESRTFLRKQNQYVLRLTPAGAVIFRLWKGDAANAVTTADSAVVADAWNHVVATFDGSSMSIYVNIVLRASRALAAPIDTTTNDLYIGSSSNSYGFLAGTLDEVAVYSSALSLARIQAHRRAARRAVVAAAGDIAGCNGGAETTAALLDGLPAAFVLTLGDNAYPYGSLSNYLNCYEPTWGRAKARTRPSLGNHEYATSRASGYFTYFADQLAPFGPGATDPARGWYSYDLASWHVVVLNSECAQVGGCGAGSPEESWLRGDLGAHPALCTLAYWHRPRFSSGSVHGSDPALQPLWQALYDYGADLILNGHDHLYERFAPQTPAGELDLARGIRQVTVGTGGYSHYGFGAILPNSEVHFNDAYGVLTLMLRPRGYDWQFLPQAGRTSSDTGSASCH